MVTGLEIVAGHARVSVVAQSEQENVIETEEARGGPLVLGGPAIPVCDDLAADALPVHVAGDDHVRVGHGVAQYGAHLVALAPRSDLERRAEMDAVDADRDRPDEDRR